MTQSNTRDGQLSDRPAERHRLRQSLVRRLRAQEFMVTLERRSTGVLHHVFDSTAPARPEHVSWHEWLGGRRSPSRASGPLPSYAAGMRFLFVMDPAEGMLADRDTTFALMRGAQARGHECLHALPHELHSQGKRVLATCRAVTVSDQSPHVTLGAEQVAELAELDAVWIRKDPPFDVGYLHLTQQLDLVAAETLVINAPQGLRDANEKLFAFHFARWMPRSLVSADRGRILDFLREVGGQAVLKPLDGYGGLGVVALSREDRNTRSLVDLLTREGRELALVQEYLPAIRGGDKRVLLLDGQPLGAILRVPREDDLRANIHVGGRVEPTLLSPAERALVEDIGPELRARGLYFVGLDLIGEKLIEVNVTSPTGIQELGRFTGTRPEEQVIAWAESAVRSRPAG
jgi:glutathione synthase